MRLKEFYFEAVWVYSDGVEIKVRYKTLAYSYDYAYKNAKNWFKKYETRSIPFRCQLYSIKLLYEKDA